MSALTASPVFNTTVIVGANGQEVRNAEWQDPLHRYNAAFAVKTYDDIETLKSFFYIMRGREQGFLIKDFQDYNVTDWTTVRETLTGAEQQFQLYKEYTVVVAGSPQTYQRDITRVAADSVRLKADSVERTYAFYPPTAETHFYVNDFTGQISYDPPSSGSTVEFLVPLFYVPVRFESDELPIDLLTYWLDSGGADNGNVQVPDIPMIEVRSAV